MMDERFDGLLVHFHDVDIGIGRDFDHPDADEHTRGEQRRKPESAKRTDIRHAARDAHGLRDDHRRGKWRGWRCRSGRTRVVP